MHTCVSPDTKLATEFHADYDPVQSVVKHALKFGHWSVLEHASVKLDFWGFPHDTAMQFRTHQRMGTLVQSQRYGDELFTKCANGLIDPRELFYFDADADESDYELARMSCVSYASAIESGKKKEVARRYLLAGYRQSFTMSGTFRQWMHVLDQRLLADTQIEAQTAAWLALDQLRGYSEFFEWYRDTRAGKNMLAP